MKNFKIKKRILSALMVLCMVTSSLSISTFAAPAPGEQKSATEGEGTTTSEVPAHNKTITSNGDGTYSLALDVTGKVTQTTTVNKANVVVIFDRSSSMINNSVSDGGTTKTRLAIAKEALCALSDSLLGRNGKDGNPDDLIQMALVVFSRTASVQKINGQTITTSNEDFQNVVKNLVTESGTNWEDALENGLSIDFKDTDPTYYIFISDGNPSWHNNARGSYQETEGMYNAAANVVKNEDNRAKLTKSGFFTIGVFGTIEKLKRLTNCAYKLGDNNTADHPNYFDAGNAQELLKAFNDIVAKIVSNGLGNVEIVDGTTQHVEVSTEMTTEVYELLNVDDQSFRYFKTKAGKKEAWTGSDVPKATFTDGTVKWDLSTIGTLEDGVTYTVEFDVAPSQYTLDLIADLDNGTVEYDSLPDEIKDYLYEKDGAYVLKTNLKNSVVDNEEVPDKVYVQYGDDSSALPMKEVYMNPDPVPAGDSGLTVTKEWRNNLDSRTASSVELLVKEDGKEFYTLTLTKDDNWTSDLAIPMGILTVKDGEVKVWSEGHDYTLEETKVDGYSSYHWEFEADTYHPMLVNGELCMLVETEAPEGMEGNYYKDSEEKEYFKLGEKVYTKGASNGKITATNARRSNLNITKVVEAGDAPEDTLFEFEIKINDATDEDLWFSVEDAKEQTVKDITTNATAEEKDGEKTGYYYIGSGETIEVSIQNGWNIRFTNLLTGTAYEVTEIVADGFELKEIGVTKGSEDITDDVLVEGSATAVSGTIDEANKLYTITYTNSAKFGDDVVETPSIEVLKKDDAGNTIDGVQFTLTKDGETAGTVYETKDGGKVTIPLDIPTDPKGEIKYTLKETSTPAGYKGTYEESFVVYLKGGEPEVKLVENIFKRFFHWVVGLFGNKNDADKQTYELTVINTALIDVPVEKVWDDEKDNDGFRPEEITVQLYIGNTAVKDQTLTLNEKNEWKGTFTGLDKYSNGEAIEYTVKESGVSDKYEASYVKSEDGKITITNTHVPETTTKTVTKVWDDGGNQDGKRASYTVQLYADGEESGDAVTLDKDTLTYTWENLPVYANGQKITYTVDETVVPTGYTATYSDDTLTITNTHVPETTSVTANKVWEDDGNRDAIRAPYTLQLKADGDAYGEAVTLDPATLTKTWDNLPKNKNVDGKAVAIKYTVEETKIGSEDVTENKAAGYTVSYSEDTLTITNTHVPETTEVTVTKIWNDGPEGHENQDALRAEYTLQLKADGDAYGEAVTLDPATLTKTWDNLPKNKNVNGEAVEIEYTVKETVVPTGYTATYSDDTLTITNTHVPETTYVTVKKVWDDGGDQDGLQKSVTVELYKNGNPTGETRTLAASDTPEANWTATFANLPVYEGSRTANVYTVVETAINGYEASYSELKDGIITITNKHTPETKEIRIVKNWVDNSNAYETRPASITVHLMNGIEEETEDIVISPENAVVSEDGNTWTYTKTVPVYRNHGTEIVYSVTEDEVSYEVVIEEPEGETVEGGENEEENTGEEPAGEQTGEEIGNEPAPEEKQVRTETRYYSTVIDGLTITNTLAPGERSVQLTKLWDDDGNRDRIRPESVTVNLYADGELYKAYDVVPNADGIWQLSVTGLPQYNNGVEIVYTAEEVRVDGYECTPSGDIKSGFTFTNTHVPATVEIAGTKTWVAPEGTELPESITINLLADGEVIDSLTVTAADGWKWNFADMPKYNDGKEIVYTITEDEVTGYMTEINGYNVTNTLAELPRTPDEPPVLPKTADTQNPMLWLAVLLMSGLALVGSGLVLKKREDEE